MRRDESVEGRPHRRRQSGTSRRGSREDEARGRKRRRSPCLLERVPYPTEEIATSADSLPLPFSNFSPSHPPSLLFPWQSNNKQPSEKSVYVYAYAFVFDFGCWLLPRFAIILAKRNIVI